MTTSFPESVSEFELEQPRSIVQDPKVLYHHGYTAKSEIQALCAEYQEALVWASPLAVLGYSQAVVQKIIDGW